MQEGGGRRVRGRREVSEENKREENIGRRVRGKRAEGGEQEER